MGEKDDNPTGKKSSDWTKWKSAEVAVQGLAETMLALDKDGEIPVYFFQGYQPLGTDNPLNVKSIIAKSNKDIEIAFSAKKPGGTTPLGQALEQLRRDHLDRLLAGGEPFTVVILTDGVPDDPARVVGFFTKLVKEHNLSDLRRERLAAFTFVQQGDDERAAEFLRHLDDDLKSTIGADVIDTKKDNFIFGTEEKYVGAQGPIELLRQAVDD